MYSETLGLTGSNVYIYGFGLTGKWLSGNLDCHVRGFIDTDEKKVGRTFNGIKVLSLEQAKKTLDGDSQIVVTVVDIQDVVPIVEALPHKDWVPLGIYLNETKALNNNTEESDSYIEYALKVVEGCHKAYFLKDVLYLRSIDIVITEKCSLRCKDCSNLMQYYEAPVDITFNEIVMDFEKLVSSVDHIYEIRLIGGEPFMNKDIYKILRHMIESPKVSSIVIYSNASIPVKMGEVDTIRHPKVVFSLTDYGDLSKNTSKVVQSLKDIGATFRLQPPMNWTDSSEIQDYNRTKDEVEKLFADCCGKNLLTATNGKLYRCPFAANAERLQAIPRDPANSVLLDAGRDAFRRYTTSINYIPACNFCKGRSFGAPEIEPAIQSEQPIPYRKYI